MSTKETDINSLAQFGPVMVTLDGAPILSYPGGKTCIYFEWAYGHKTPQGWREYISAGRSMNPVTVLTPHGLLELRIYQLRLYLSPASSSTYSVKDSKKAPAEVCQRILAEKRPVVIEEYRLETGRRYYAKVEVDTYYLPPLPGEDRPSEARNSLLALSDLPWLNGKPQRPMTPACLGFSY